MKRLISAFALAVAVTLAAGCNGTTGSGLVAFRALAGGPEGVVAGAPLTFTSGTQYDIALTEARYHIGAVYFNESVPTSGSPDRPCILPGVYVDEVFGACSATGDCGVDVDLLSPALVPFPTPGDGTLNQAVTAEVWLTGGDINATDDETPILQVAGTATKAGASWPFTGLVTIGTNHTIATTNPAMPGANPICRQRIVSPICGANPTPNDSCPPLIGMLSDGGTLDMRIDPRPMFDSVDFSTLAPSGSTSNLAIPDASAGAGGELFGGVRSNSNEISDAVYTFTWTDKGP